MSTSVFLRSVGSLALTWGAIACAPDTTAERDTAAIDSVASADSAGTSGIRDDRGGRDSAMAPDFGDPAKRLPPAP